MRLKIKYVLQNHKKNQNKNFVKKINHEYFGGSDVTNALRLTHFLESEKQKIKCFNESFSGTEAGGPKTRFWVGKNNLKL